MTLYELTAALKVLVNQLEDADLPEEEIAQVIDDTMSSIGEEEKFDAYGKVILQQTSDVDVLDAEIKRLTELKKRKKVTIDRMKESLATYMTVKNVDKIDTGLFRFGFRATESVEIIDAEILAPEFVRTKIVEEADKTAIKNAIKSGTDVPGAVLVKERKVQIK